MNATRGAYFGRRAFGTISGTMDFFQMFGLVLGPIFAGVVFDVTESYTIAFASFAVSAIASSVLMVFLRPPREQILGAAGGVGKTPFRRLGERDNRKGRRHNCAGAPALVFMPAW